MISTAGSQGLLPQTYEYIVGAVLYVDTLSQYLTLKLQQIHEHGHVGNFSQFPPCCHFLASNSPNLGMEF